MYHQFKELADVDITAGPMEVGPTCHYIMGGVKVEADTAQTRVPGLFAAGEVAGGMHGANRLGGNSLSDLIVFGRRAGMGACDYVKGLKDTPKHKDKDVEAAIEELDAPLNRTEGPNPYDLHKKMNEIMGTHVGIFREAQDMKQGVEKVAELKKEIAKVRVGGGKKFNPGWHLSRDLKNLIIAAEAVAISALSREESRGAHSRLDFPDLDDKKWGHVNTTLTKDGDKMKLEHKPLPEMPADLKSLFEKKEPVNA